MQGVDKAVGSIKDLDEGAAVAALGHLLSIPQHITCMDRHHRSAVRVGPRQLLSKYVCNLTWHRIACCLGATQSNQITTRSTNVQQEETGLKRVTRAGAGGGGRGEGGRVC